MNILKKLFAVIMAIAFVMQLNISALAVEENDSLITYSVFKKQDVAKKLENTVILSLNASYGFINNIKSKINEGYNVSPYKFEDEIYIPAEYVANGMKITIIPEGIIGFSNNGIKRVYLQDEVVVKNDIIFVPVYDFCEKLQLEVTVFDDLIIIHQKDNSFENIDKNMLDEMKNALSYEWESYQIHAYGFTTGLIQHPKNKNVIWARTDVGGAYKLDVKSGNWICMTDSISGYREPGIETWAHQPVASLAIDPNDENTVYMAVGSSQYAADKPYGAIYKTTDGGLSWRMLSLRKVFYATHYARMMGEMLAVDPNNSNVVYCGTHYDGMWKSEDAGETWTQINEISKGVRGTHDGFVSSVVIDSSEVIDGKSANVYIGVMSSGVYQSTDGGNSFFLMKGSPTAPTKLLFVNKMLYVSSGARSEWAAYSDETSKGLFTYKNNQWSKIPGTLGFENPNIGSVYVDEKNPNKIFACVVAYTYPRKIYWTNDGGNEWNNVTLDDNFNSNACSFVEDPYNSEDLLLAWGFGVSRIKNTATNTLAFELFDAGIEELMFRHIACLPEESNWDVVTGCCDKGSILINDDGYWEQAKQPTGNFSTGLDFCESDPDIIARTHMGHGKPPGNVILTEDGGKTWIEAAYFKTAKPGNIAVGATKQKNGYPIIMFTTVTEGEEALYRSFDLGKNWEKIECPINLVDRGFAKASKYLISDRINGNVFYLCSSDGYLYRTNNGGDTWVKISALRYTDFTAFFSECIYIQAPFNKEGHIWACLGNNGLSYSTDYGVKWESVSGITRAKTITFGKPKKGSDIPTIFVTGTCNGVDGIFMSDDYGKSFTNISSSFSYGGSHESYEIGGDRQKYGKVWVLTSGRGIFWGEPKDGISERPIIAVENKNNQIVCEKDYIVKGKINVLSEVRVNNIPTPIASDGSFEGSVQLEEGKNTITIEAVDDMKNVATPVYLEVEYQPSYINIVLDNPEVLTNKDTTIISGSVNRKADLYINSEKVNVDENLRFSYNTKLDVGTNIYKVLAVAETYVKEAAAVVKYDNVQPTLSVQFDKEVVGDGVIVTGNLSEPGEIRLNGIEIFVKPDNSFECFLPIKPGIFPVIVQGRDFYGNVAKPIISSVSSKKLTDYSYHDDKIKYAGENFKLTGDLLNDFGELPYFCNLIYAGDTDNAVTFGLRWDEKALYVGARIVDESLHSAGTQLYEKDSLEIYVDGNNSRVDHKNKTTSYKQFLVPFEGDATEGIERITKITDYGFDMEVMIPWDKVGTGVSVSEGHKIGFDIDNCDSSGNQRDGQLGWCGDSTSYLRTDRYATMTLIK